MPRREGSCAGATIWRIRAITRCAVPDLLSLCGRRHIAETSRLLISRPRAWAFGKLGRRAAYKFTPLRPIDSPFAINPSGIWALKIGTAAGPPPSSSVLRIRYPITTACSACRPTSLRASYLYRSSGTLELLGFIQWRTRPRLRCAASSAFAASWAYRSGRRNRRSAPSRPFGPGRNLHIAIE